MKPFGKKTNNEYDRYEEDFINPTIEDLDDGVVEDYEPEEEEAAPVKPAVKRPAGSNMLKVIAPRSYDDAPAIVGHLMDGYTVVLNIEGMERAAAMRLIDFLLGALEVLEGDFRPVTKTTLVFSPTADVSDDDDADEDIDN